MLFGSTFPDAQGLFVTAEELRDQWGTGERRLLFIPLERRDEVDRLLGSRQVVLEETSGKALITDRPLDLPSASSLDSTTKEGGTRTP
jgi:1-acyl-sn-glycerol-3-phosphate acyltransferase